MTDNNSNLTEDLASEIENAVDDLFGRYELSAGGGKKQEAPAEPQEEAPAAPEPEIDLRLESEEEDGAAAVSETPAAPAAPAARPEPARPQSADADRLLAEMEEAILTVDWEVNEKNVRQARTVLAGLRTALGLAGGPADEVAGLMDDVLRCMEETPGDAPTTGPAHLKDGLAAIRAWAGAGGGAPDRETGDMLARAARELRESLPVARKDGVLDLGAEERLDLTLELESAAAETAGGPASRPEPERVRVPDGMEKVLSAYAASLARAVKRLGPMDELFGRTPGMEKLHRLTSRVLASINSLVEDCATCFTDGFTTATGKAAAGGIEEFLDGHRKTLGACVDRLLPMESLFGKNRGYEKLHRLTRKIRSGLEREQDALERAMAGDYEPAPVMADLIDQAREEQASREAGPAPDHAGMEMVARDVAECLRILDGIDDGDLVKTVEAVDRIKRILSGLQKRLPGQAAAGEDARPPATAEGGGCPWPILLKAVWGGRTVAFVPEQVAYQSPRKTSARKAAKTSFFALKKLKSAPWTNLRSLVSGELANESGRALAKMEFPVVHPPEDFPGSGMKKQTMILLYRDGLGKACFLDSPTEVLHVPEDAKWEEVVDSETGQAGLLTIDGEDIPVFSL